MKAKVVMVESILRIRIDTFRQQGEPGYEGHHIGEGQDNPCLCQFIKVPIFTTQEQISEILREHVKRVKAAAPNVKAPEIQNGLQEHLKSLGLSGMAAVTDKFMGVEVTE